MRLKKSPPSGGAYVLAGTQAGRHPQEKPGDFGECEEMEQVTRKKVIGAPFGQPPGKDSTDGRNSQCRGPGARKSWVGLRHQEESGQS